MTWLKDKIANLEDRLRRNNIKIRGKILSKFGFEGHILAAIQALYLCLMAQVYTSDLLSKQFTISNRTQQGCPQSLTIFNLVIEPLVEAIC